MDLAMPPSIPRKMGDDQPFMETTWPYFDHGFLGNTTARTGQGCRIKTTQDVFAESGYSWIFNMCYYHIKQLNPLLYIAITVYCYIKLSLLLCFSLVLNWTIHFALRFWLLVSIHQMVALSAKQDGTFLTPWWILDACKKRFLDIFSRYVEFIYHWQQQIKVLL